MLLTTDKPRILAIGAHPDDIELGAAGLIYRLVIELGAQIQLLVLTHGLQHWSRGKVFEHEARAKETREAAGVLGLEPSGVEVLDFPDCELHLHLHDVIKQIELRLFQNGNIRHDLILTHAEADTHSDHRVAYEATVAAARAYGGTILLYQAVSTIPNRFRPTCFVSLTDKVINVKQKALNCHESQRTKAFMRRAWSEGLAKGWACFLRRPDELLEAFEVHRTFWNHITRAPLIKSLPPKETSSHKG